MVSLRPFTETSVLVSSSTSGVVHVDALAVSEQTYPCKISRGIMDIFRFCSFYALVITTSNTTIGLGEHQRIALENLTPIEITPNKDNESSPYLPTHALVKSVNLCGFQADARRSSTSGPA